jgi:hypothetical protein
MPGGVEFERAVQFARVVGASCAGKCLDIVWVDVGILEGFALGDRFTLLGGDVALVGVLVAVAGRTRAGLAVCAHEPTLSVRIRACDELREA